MLAVMMPSKDKPVDGWMSSFRQAVNGLKYSLYRVSGLPIMEARLCLLETAVKNGQHSWYLFLDDDVLLPAQAIPQLMQRGLDIVSGVYCTKSYPSHAVYATLDNAGMYQYDTLDWKSNGAPFKVDVVGMGCLLVSSRVIKSIGIDNAFRWDWMRKNAQGKEYMQSKGEDVWFCEQAKLKGFGVYVDPKVLCIHVGRLTGKSYPENRYWKNHVVLEK